MNDKDVVVSMFIEIKRPKNVRELLASYKQIRYILDNCCENCSDLGHKVTYTMKDSLTKQTISLTQRKEIKPK